MKPPQKHIAHQCLAPLFTPTKAPFISEVLAECAGNWSSCLGQLSSPGKGYRKAKEMNAWEGNSNLLPSGDLSGLDQSAPS